MTVCLRCGFQVDGNVCACVAIREGWEAQWVENRTGHIRRARERKKHKDIAEIRRLQPLIRAGFEKLRKSREGAVK